MASRMNKFIVSLRLGGLLLLVSACSFSPGVRNLQNGNEQATFEWKSSSGEITIPFKWHDGHIIIPITVNGSEPLRLAFDSGAAVTVLFESERANGLKLNIERQLTLNSSGQIANVINDNTIGLGGVELKNLTILHVPLEHSPIFSSVDDAYFDGAIGYDLLSRFTIMVDYVNETLTLSQKQSGIFDPVEWQALPIDTAERVPYVDALLNSDSANGFAINKASKLLVDTGAPFYLYINPDLHTKIELPTRFYESKGNGFNGSYHRFTGRLEKLTIGKYHFTKLATHFDRTDFRDLAGIGLLGNALLKKFDLVFDYSSETLFVRPNSEFSDESALDKSGLDIKPHSKGAIVLAVAPNTAADRVGLKAQDVITDFDAIPISAANFDELKNLLSSEKNHTKLCWINDVKKMCAQLALSPRIYDES